MTSIQLNNLEGLITFPSFHTAIAILFAWAVWRTPYVWFAGLVTNVLMILSTPLSGSHYVIDLAGGAVVATVAIALASRVRCAAVQSAERSVFDKQPVAPLHSRRNGLACNPEPGREPAIRRCPAPGKRRDEPGQGNL